MHLTDHERSEWARMAQAAYNRSRSDVGHRMSVAASRSVLTVAEFDARAAEYRRWLVFDELTPEEATR